MFYVNSYVFAYKKEGIMYLRGRSMQEIAIEPQISQEFINDQGTIRDRRSIRQ